jgi:protein SCO1/2
MRRRAFISSGLGALAAYAPASAGPKPPPGEMKLDETARLLDQNGRPVSGRDLIGKPTLLYFGYVFCPEICPTTLASMGQWMKRLGRDADRVNFVFVTIDPERDTPRALKRFLSDFDPRIKGLTGTPDNIGKLVRAFHVYVEKVPVASGDYVMDHSTSAYLLDKAGYFVEAFNYNVATAQAVWQILYVLHTYG